jgi:hypothetical protein
MAASLVRPVGPEPLGPRSRRQGRGIGPVVERDDPSAGDERQRVAEPPLRDLLDRDASARRRGWREAIGHRSDIGRCGREHLAERVADAGADAHLEPAGLGALEERERQALEQLVGDHDRRGGRPCAAARTG